MGLVGASMSIPRGEGAAKAWYCPLVLLWQSQCTGHVCLKFVMSNSFNVWGPLANESIPFKHVLGWGGAESRGGGGWCGLKFSVSRTCLSLKHPLPCRAFTQLECTAKSRVSFWWTLNVSLLIRNQEESHLKRTMGKSWVSCQYLPEQGGLIFTLVESV